MRVSERTSKQAKVHDRRKREGEQVLNRYMMSPSKYAHNNNNMVKVIWILNGYKYDDKQRHLHTLDPSHILTVAFIYLYARIRFVSENMLLLLLSFYYYFKCVMAWWWQQQQRQRRRTDVNDMMTMFQNGELK